MRISPFIVVLVGAIAVSGCAQKGLRDLRPNGPGPDEFMVLPNKPLTPPTNYSALPAPTPGGGNLVDPTPKADLVAALGGRSSALDPNAAIPGSDGALVTAASRYGVEPGVRSSLATEDAAYRKRARRTGRIKLFPVDRYAQAYRKESLNPFNETEKFRRSGFGTPSAPPSDL
ncbi:DUF3035 domain-containing protein [Aliisedimentitalea scapharcae]|uniref:DUF3035 domain-containing protein n=1 Tax=Aliisedimentitalea scapharcae TaxID=1524259 RepID=A0ABZ2XS50_9RHOB|nr:DUF3035 domain-containing protein [Rhodobacteraceae bacterium M382]